MAPIGPGLINLSADGVAGHGPFGPSFGDHSTDQALTLKEGALRTMQSKVGAACHHRLIQSPLELRFLTQFVRAGLNHARAP